MTQTECESKAQRIIVESERDFHSRGPITIVAVPEQAISDNMGNFGQVRKLWKLTPWQVRRILKHFCGMQDCTCGSSPLLSLSYYENGNEVFGVTRE